MIKILLLSGPNLDELGTRNPTVYGTLTLDDHVQRVRALAGKQGWELTHLQSNFEGVLIEQVHGARGVFDAIIINAGALTHSSWSLHDALDNFAGPIVEVHLSNPAGRESFRHTSTLAPVVSGTIAGFGALSYDLAVVALVDLVGERSHTDESPNA